MYESINNIEIKVLSHEFTMFLVAIIGDVLKLNRFLSCWIMHEVIRKTNTETTETQ